MTATTAASTDAPASAEKEEKGHIGLVVLGAVAFGLLLGLLLVLLVFPGGPEHEMTGTALIALGAGFVVLALASSRFTDQPQTWALIPGVVVAALGLTIWALSPSEHTLALSGWIWPLLLLALVVWSVRGARGELHNWSRRAVLYPALFVLLLIAAGGTYETVTEATSSNPPLGGRTYFVNGHRLYLNCVGHGEPTVLLFNGLGERTPSWAWVSGLSRPLTVSAPTTGPARAGARGSRALKTANSSRPTCTAYSPLRTFQARMCWPGTRSAASTSSFTPRSTPSRLPVSP